MLPLLILAGTLGMAFWCVYHDLLRRMTTEEPTEIATAPENSPGARKKTIFRVERRDPFTAGIVLVALGLVLYLAVGKGQGGWARLRSLPVAAGAVLVLFAVARRLDPGAGRRETRRDPEE